MGYIIDNFEIQCPPEARRAVIEDSIFIKNRQTTAGSEILKGFMSPIDATVVSRLQAKDVKIIGKSRMDEFGISGLFADELVETSGAVTAVACGAADFALCNDYTGFTAQQAAACGLCYVQPTYGSVSRYGLVHTVSSMDQIGIVCRSPAEGYHVLSIISGYDHNDGVMYTDSHKADERVCKTVGIPVNVVNQMTNKSMIYDFAKGYKIIEFELCLFEVFKQVMQILCCAELGANLSRYDGISFGYRAEDFKDVEELYLKSRAEGFGENAKLASILSVLLLSQENYMHYYDKAMRIRRIIKESLEFDKYDLIVMPAVSFISNGSQEKRTDRRLELQALSRLCGLPSLTVPFADDALTLIADANRESILFSALHAERQ